MGRVDLGPIHGSTTALPRERGREWLESIVSCAEMPGLWNCLFFIRSLFYFRLVTLTLVSKVATMGKPKVSPDYLILADGNPSSDDSSQARP